LFSILTLSCAHTPEIIDERGESIQGSIASLEQVEIGGRKQWICVRGNSLDAPVLLWLHGGPGASEIGWNRKYLQALEENVVFVNWEQLGAGKSYAAADFTTITIQDYVDDAIALSEYLRSRFEKENIILVGHSWGTVIGLKAAHQRPDLFSSYTGIAQQVNLIENDTLMYQKVLEQARSKDNQKLIEKLSSQGPPPYSTDNVNAYGKLYSHGLKLEPEGLASLRYRDMFFPEEYSLFDSLRTYMGMSKSFKHVQIQQADLDMEQDIPRVEIPVFFVTGRHDYICIQDITFRYFNLLKAPVKKFYWFEQSGHFPCYQEPELFIQVMRSEIVNGGD
jgi:pimeloyl-ACP methyl ester carboxylesterase